MATGSLFGINEYIERIKADSTGTYVRNSFPLSRYKSEEIENIKVLFEYGLNKRYYSHPDSIDQIALNKLQEFAMENEELRDNVTSYLRQLASSTPKLSYLNREAINVQNKYYEENSEEISLKKSLSMYSKL